uniref:Fumarate reductase subunit C n=1 Tax=Candidatus Kentrum sp. SD TaxID=2126332 RepID=A0A450YDR3_9GAMM|nr:MAG: fumarate reductase subunit C [Candidatus Kentron sp. SD]VFK39603.1 MAG: fumarate reductase subunit C [Candidatus Kentron sp. SD]VFK78075.1 MAG: fumarate reductase subunit C [Candidatus Kentron sp. SD]
MSRKPYIREVPKASWYLRQGRYVRYMAREVTCIFIGIYTFLLLAGVGALSKGEDAYSVFLQALQSPLSVAFLIVALLFSIYHAMAWFNVTPQAMPVQVGEDFLPGGIIVGAHYAIWAVVTIAVLFFAGVF